MAHDYSKYYDLERYLLTDVNRRFLENGTIKAVDFFMILIWKANRAKNKHKKRLTKISDGSFPKAVERISRSLFASADRKQRLKILMNEWGFRLATATAILTVLYPKQFSVYDVRVCGQLRPPGRYNKLAAQRFSEHLWQNYEQFLDAVKASVPQKRALRDKDRFLWGRSFYDDVVKAVGKA